MGLIGNAQKGVYNLNPAKTTVDGGRIVVLADSGISDEMFDFVKTELTYTIKNLLSTGYTELEIPLVNSGDFLTSMIAMKLLGEDDRKKFQFLIRLPWDGIKSEIHKPFQACYDNTLRAANDVFFAFEERPKNMLNYRASWDAFFTQLALTGDTLVVISNDNPGRLRQAISVARLAGKKTIFINSKVRNA